VSYLEEVMAERDKLRSDNERLWGINSKLVAALRLLVDDCSDPERLHLIPLPVFMQIEKSLVEAERLAVKP
jgi:hypothetical protein